MSFTGKVAIVTGAASGVGREVVEQLVDAEAKVVAVDIAPSVHELESEAVRAVEGDTSFAATAEQAVAEAVDRFGRLDVLVNNSAYAVWKPILDTSEDEWDRVLSVNVKSMFLYCRAAIPVLQRQGGGAIVATASISGVVGLAGQAAYAASKGAVVMLTRQLAVEYAPAGIRVNAVAPGAIDTPFLQNVVDLADDPAALREAIAGSHPLGRIGRAEEAARAILFLASDDAAFITGTVLMIDGGYTAA